MNELYSPLVGVDGRKFDYKGLGQIAYATKSAKNMQKEVIRIGDGGYETAWQVKDIKDIKDIEINIFGHQVFTLITT